MTTELTITRPDDWHVHFRDGERLNAVVPFTAAQCGRAIVMPNLSPPVVNVKLAKEYRERILQGASDYPHFDPLMTLYLTEETTAEDIQQAWDSGFVQAVKLYPAGATTNSAAGVRDIGKAYPALERMQTLGMPLLTHGEVVDDHVDIFDREAEFIDRVLKRLLTDFPTLKIVCEHITTADMAEFVASQGDRVGATITPQHLMFNRNQLLVGGVKPHYYCLPILKRERHRQVLVEMATSANPKFFLGTDTAPHPTGCKHSACGCAGIFSAPMAIELYATIFEQADALDKLEGFASFYGADFYGLPRNTDTITLIKQDWKVPGSYSFADDVVVPILANEILSWKMQ